MLANLCPNILYGKPIGTARLAKATLVAKLSMSVSGYTCTPVAHVQSEAPTCTEQAINASFVPLVPN